MKTKYIYYSSYISLTPHLQDTDPSMLVVQKGVSQLIYRYLATLSPDTSRGGAESADQKTRLLLSLVQHIHTAAHIMQHRTRKNQLGSATSPQPLTSTHCLAMDSTVSVINGTH